MTVFALLVAGVMSSCGLGSDRERAVGNANVAIADVDAAGARIASEISALSEAQPGQRDLSLVREAGNEYLAAVEVLNGAIREMGATSATLQTHVQSTFLPAAETAANDCQRALEQLRGDSVDDETLRSAITHLGRCIDRYANAVGEVSKAYSNLSE